ncbi:hypothetical protein [Sneathiella limimaris]|uniref:capsular polysaccharide export protein, LipB/KpsS family n=1 Tax=Sneathiella limimaris TaxID=1964213 RepID=UPI00146F18F9|nr:hypothetical protein [Sneathiella limimaris]
MRYKGAICCFAWRAHLDHWNDMVIETAAELGWPIFISPQAIPPAGWIWKAVKRGVRFHIARNSLLKNLKIETLLCFNGRFEWQKPVISSAETVYYFETGPLYQSIIIDRGLGEQSGFREQLPGLLSNIEPDLDWIESYKQGQKTKYPEDQNGSVKIDNYVAVPLQSGRDRQIINDSEVTVRGFVHEVSVAAKETGVRVVFKPHPRDLESDHISWVLRQYVDNQIIFLSTAAIGDFLQKSNWVCTINSGSTIDAFFHGKQVLQRGFSLYDQSDSLIFARDIAAGFRKLQDEAVGIRQRRVLQQLKLLTWLKSEYLYGFEQTGKPTADGFLNHFDKIKNRLADG